MTQTLHLFPRIEKGVVRPRDGHYLAVPTLRLPRNYGSWRDGGKSRRVHYPFEDMDIGDSFFVPDGGRSSITVAMSQLRRRKGLTIKISIRNWLEDGKPGLRVWRVL